MEPLSFDSHAETDVVIMFPTSEKVFCLPRLGIEPGTSRTATTPSSQSSTEAPYIYIHVYRYITRTLCVHKCDVAAIWYRMDGKPRDTPQLKKKKKDCGCI